MSEMPRYNPAPEAFVPAQAPTAPPIMNTIFFMLLGAAVLHIVATILGIMNVTSDSFRNQVEQQLSGQNMPETTPEIVDATIMFTLVTSLAIGVVGVIVYVVIGLFIKKGMGWARIVGLVLAALSLGQLVGMTMPGGIAVILQVLLGIAAMVLCFTGPAAAFFTAKKNFKLASKTP
ncbi:hypothetical protein [Arthrobacter glacialis]|uniref:DUF4064 domain-containing protein n=1 Tax=Arthrobacter glacialis TaxID=1664 RepID=A0A2S3ZZY6_ARTGL|nr:hypothetical protein [Arthrobacter glacialis]POH59844.1 hypothetical protein CVS28_06175 [Arthrobacter glacialis]POH74472.1 hypothetical protein CVS27_04370 [Arthrobacter glacialis]